MAATALLATGLSLATTTTAAAAEVVGTPWTVGGNGFGQLGSGTTVARLTAAPVTGGLTDVIDLHGGREHGIALRSNGTVWTWGSNVEGQLGIGTTGNRSTPVQVPGLSNITAVETGHNYSLALRADGTVWTWGLNSDGQLGDGSITTRRSPVQVAGLTNATAIAGGRNMSYAIRSDGSVVGWGRNDEGQVGDGTTTRRPSPVRVGTLSGVTRISGGRDHGLAVRTDGSVWAWGSNDYGQVGDGTTTDRTSPVQVLSTGATDVAGGAHHSYALRSDGRVSAWGRNYRTNLGDGSTTQRTRPVTVQNVLNAVTLGSLRDAGVVTLADGRAMTWGHNLNGQLGDGSTTNRTSAVYMSGVTNAVKAGGGGSEFSVVLVGAAAPPANVKPTANFDHSCVELTCSFDAGDSADSDGTITSYAWAYGGGGTDTGETPQHTFAAAGSYPVTLTVTDDDGATATVTRTVTVTRTPPPNTDPAASFSFDCQGLSCTFDGRGSTDADGDPLTYAWSFGDAASGTGATTQHSYGSAQTYAVTLTVSDGQASDSATRQVTVTAPPAADVTFRAAAGYNGNSQQPGATVPAAVRAGDRLLLFVSTNRAATATTPTGWTPLGTVSDGTDVRSWAFTKTATAADAGSTPRSTLDAYSKSSAVVVAYVGAGAPGATVGAAEAGSGTSHAAPAAGSAAAGSLVVRHWVDKVNEVHGWTYPSGVAGRNTTSGSGSGQLNSALGDSTLGTAGVVGAASVTAGVASAKAIAWTVVLPPS